MLGECRRRLPQNGREPSWPSDRTYVPRDVSLRPGVEIADSLDLLFRLLIELFCPEFFGHNGGSPLGPQCAKSFFNFLHHDSTLTDQPVTPQGASPQSLSGINPYGTSGTRSKVSVALGKSCHSY